MSQFQTHVEEIFQSHSQEDAKKQLETSVNIANQQYDIQWTDKDGVTVSYNLSFSSDQFQGASALEKSIDDTSNSISDLLSSQLKKMGSVGESEKLSTGLEWLTGGMIVNGDGVGQSTSISTSIALVQQHPAANENGREPIDLTRASRQQLQDMRGLSFGAQAQLMRAWPSVPGAKEGVVKTTTSAEGAIPGDVGVHRDGVYITPNLLKNIQTKFDTREDYQRYVKQLFSPDSELSEAQAKYMTEGSVTVAGCALRIGWMPKGPIIAREHHGQLVARYGMDDSFGQVSDLMGLVRNTLTNKGEV